jgi:hypothetical protein
MHNKTSLQAIIHRIVKIKILKIMVKIKKLVALSHSFLHVKIKHNKLDGYFKVLYLRN